MESDRKSLFAKTNRNESGNNIIDGILCGFSDGNASQWKQKEKLNKKFFASRFKTENLAARKSFACTKIYIFIDVVRVECIKFFRFSFDVWVSKRSSMQTHHDHHHYNENKWKQSKLSYFRLLFYSVCHKNGRINEKFDPSHQIQRVQSGQIWCDFCMCRYERKLFDV